MTNWQKQYNKKCILDKFGDCKYWKRDKKNESGADDKYFPEEIKQFISTLLEAQAKEDMLKCKQAKILTAEASYRAGQLMAIKEIEEWVDKNEKVVCRTSDWKEDYTGVLRLRHIDPDELKAKLKTLTK